jgi:hypothetical protein
MLVSAPRQQQLRQCPTCVLLVLHRVCRTLSAGVLGGAPGRRGSKRRESNIQHFTHHATRRAVFIHPQSFKGGTAAAQFESCMGIQNRRMRALPEKPVENFLWSHETTYTPTCNT